jgi:prevent-host-death family protein
MARTGATKRITVHEAKTQLSRLIARALAGDEVVISRGDVPVVRLVPVARDVPARKFGAMKGRARVTSAFFEPLPEDELAGWE